MMSLSSEEISPHLKIVTILVCIFKMFKLKYFAFKFYNN